VTVNDTVTDDIVERLRARKATWQEAIIVMELAADEIERLREVIGRLRYVIDSLRSSPDSSKAATVSNLAALIARARCFKNEPSGLGWSMSERELIDGYGTTLSTEDVETLWSAVCHFQHVIRAGHGWTPQCGQIYPKALDVLRKLGAPHALPSGQPQKDNN
jgi:hypothetical protein